MKFDFQQIINQYKASWQYLKAGGYRDVYQLLFGSAQFPFWSTVQAVWACFLIKRSYEKKETSSMFSKIYQYFISFIITFGTREILAVFLHKLSPLIHYPKQFLIFNTIFILINFFPFSLVHKLINIFYYFLGMLQGINQARLFTLVIRNTKNMPIYQSLLISFFVINFDYINEIISRKLFKGFKTNISHFIVIFRTILFSLIFYLVTTKNMFNQYLGFYQVHLPALALCFVLGAFGSSTIDEQSSNK